MNRAGSGLRIAFVNMPFADWHRPSLALSQLTSMIHRDFGDEVTVDISYVNQDMATFLGTLNYESISGSSGGHHVNTGLGDWLFRQIAFPDTPDNSDEYFQRFYPGMSWAPFREQAVGVQSQLLQFCEKVIDRYQLAEADVVGFSSMFAQNVPSIALARLIKERNPRVLTVIGGANCEAPMGAVIAELVPAVDFIFSGPALETFPAFVRCVLDGEPQAADAIPGIVSRRNCREPEARDALGRDHNINDVCLPDYDSFTRALDEHEELERTGTVKPMLPFETSRGCWWGERSHCTFCGLNGQGMAYRAMSPELAIEQFNWLFGFADRYPGLTCTDNVMPRNYPIKVFEKLDPPPGVSIFYEVKLPLSRQNMKRLVAAGVTIVQPGIEALATSTLKLMAKGTTSFINLQFLKNCADLGITPSWNLLIGFPGEDPAVYEGYARNIPLLAHLPPPSGVFMIRFDRFSPYFDQREEYGLDLHPMDNYALTYPFSPEALSQLAYFFADHTIAPYTLNAVRWHGQLSKLVDDWKAAWPEAKQPPELRLEGSETTGWRIRDSRSGKPVVHQADGPMSSLIRTLSSPGQEDQIATGWAGGSDDLASRLGWLREHAMLFEENGKLLSLVLSGDDEVQEDTDTGPGLHQLLPLEAVR
jgi:ribosomal peptide maturation radical SAM protein 1